MRITTPYPTRYVSGLPRPGGGLGHRAEHGMALVMTLFVVALLTVLVLEYHFDAVIELDMAANYANDTRAHHLALAGMHFAQALLKGDDPNSDGPEDSWYTLSLVPACIPPQQLLELAASTEAAAGTRSAPSPSTSFQEDRSAQDTSDDVGCVVLRISDESGKLPLNALDPSGSSQTSPEGATTAPEGKRPTQPRRPNPTAPNPAPGTKPWTNIFTLFFDSFGINKEVIGALKDWIDSGDGEEPDGGAEESYYTSLPTPYTTPNRPMRMLGELRLIKGFDTETLAKLFPGIPPQAIADIDLGRNPYLTPYGAADATVNLNTADPVVLHALIEGLGGNSSCVENEILPARQQGQLSSLPAGLCGVQKLRDVAGVKSTYFRIETLGQVGAIRKKIVAVVKRSSGNAPQSSSTMEYFKIE